jgi:mono/diheme cytochrome c family protein
MKKITFLLAYIIGLGLNLLADAETGKAVFASNCAICHTTNGGSALGPDMNIVSYTRKKQEIYNYAKDPYEYYKEFGYSANAMPTLPLEEQELKDVADYISSLQPFKKWMKKK